MIPTRSRLSRVVVVGVTLAGLLVAGGTPAFAQEDDVSFTANPLTPEGAPQSGAKSASGRLAQSDPALLQRSDAAATAVMVKVDVDPVASYAGGVDGYAATSPEVTGISLADGSPAIDAYTAYVTEAVAAAQAEAAALIPTARILSSYVTVYGGFAMTIPANRAKDLAALSSVAAVQANELRKIAVEDTAIGTATPAPDTATPTPSAPETPATETPAPEATTPAPEATTPAPEPETPAPEATTPDEPADERAGAPADVVLPPTTPAPDADATTFIGADKVWPSLGGRDRAGEGVIVGVIDSGIWPEHPMLADNGIPTPAGGPWACEFGVGGDDAFACNDKLIGAYAFLDSYQQSQDLAEEDYCLAGVCSARDSDGHGTHTATTAAGSYASSAEVFGVDRGPVSGVAPGASVIAYRVCGPDGCFSSDSVAAVGQALLDGVDVLNFSISGGNSAYTDPVELAFLDAFAGGITVNASAGNDGPGAATANHAGPWTTTVAASTSDRAFTSALILTSSDGAGYVKQGTTITDGVTGAPVVQPEDVAGYPGTKYCDEPFAPGSVTGQVVLCIRGGDNSGGRVEKGYYASLGGAAGMILANPVPQDLQTDNHFLPTIQLEGPNDELIAFLADHPDVVATWAQGEATVSQGDVMAAFSSRGPLGDFLKPDVTAPGVQVLAGHTPTPTEIAGGPAGQLFQAIAGTSMSSPHAAGVSALVKAAHATWTPGQIKSALMTSSVQDVVNVDGSKAGVFDRGAGSIRADRAIAPVLTISESAADFAASAADAMHRVDLNIASINVDPLPGAVSTTRTVTNVSGKSQTFSVKATGAGGLRLTILPSKFTLAAGKSRELRVVIDGLNAEDGWHEGQITLTPSSAGASKVVIPVAANVGEAEITLSQTCDPTTIKRGATTTCTVSAANYMPVPVDARIDAAPNPLLQLQSVTAPAKKKALSAEWVGTLAPALPPTVAGVDLAPGTSPGGYLPLEGFGISPFALGDEEISNFNVPAFKYGSETYTRIGVVSNGYLVVGGGTSSDVEFEPAPFPSASSPNNVLAPLWTDLDPSKGGELRAGTLTDGASTWLVVEFKGVSTWSGNADNSFQVWITLDPAAEGIWFTYGSDAVGDAASAVATGAENRDGTSGVELAELPSEGDEVAVTTAPPSAGGTVSFDYTLRGLVKGKWSTFATLRSDALRTTPVEQTEITVK